MELTCTPLTEASEDVVCSSNPVQTFSAGPTCKLLTKNAIFQSPEEDGSIFVCAGDEASNSAMVSPVLFSVGDFIAILWERSFISHSIYVLRWELPCHKHYPVLSCSRC